MDEKSYTEDGGPLIISMNEKSKFEQLYPEYVGLIEIFEREGLVVIVDKL